MIADLMCEASRRERDGLHLCGRAAGHLGDHVCANAELCGVAWAPLEIVRADHLGPCDTCGQVVRAGTECSETLEGPGVAVHGLCCDTCERLR